MQLGPFLFFSACALFRSLVLTLFQFFGSIMRRVFHVAPCLLCLALYLLRGTFYLSFLIAGPLARLALRSSCRVIQCAFHMICIHNVHLV
jgi:hypothetical protein